MESLCSPSFPNIFPDVDFVPFSQLQDPACDVLPPTPPGEMPRDEMGLPDLSDSRSFAPPDCLQQAEPKDTEAESLPPNQG